MAPAVMERAIDGGAGEYNSIGDSGGAACVTDLAQTTAANHTQSIIGRDIHG